MKLHYVRHLAEVVPHFHYSTLGIGCSEEPARWPGSREGGLGLCPSFRENPNSLPASERCGLRDVIISRTSIFLQEKGWQGVRHFQMAILSDLELDGYVDMPTNIPASSAPGCTFPFPPSFLFLCAITPTHLQLSLLFQFSVEPHIQSVSKSCKFFPYDVFWNLIFLFIHLT